MEKEQIINYKADILMNRKYELGGALLEREQINPQLITRETY